MIDREHDLPIVRQAKAPKVSRGSVYYACLALPATFRDQPERTHRYLRPDLSREIFVKLFNTAQRFDRP